MEPLIEVIATTPDRFEIILEGATDSQQKVVNSFTYTSQLVRWLQRQPAYVQSNVMVSMDWQAGAKAIIRGSMSVATTETATFAFLRTSTDRIALWWEGDRVQLGTGCATDKVMFEFGAQMNNFETACLQDGMVTLSWYIENRFIRA